jgi:hypothetical protein
MKSEDRVPFGIGSGLAMLANLIVVIQYAGKHMAVAVLAVLAVWVVAIAYGRRILRWLIRYRRDLLFLFLGGLLASAGIAGVLHARTGPSVKCPPLPASTLCPDVTTTPEPVLTPVASPVPAEIVYRTQSGKRYHRETCRYVRTNPNATALTIEEAGKQGLTPCQSCNPPPLP